MKLYCFRNAGSLTGVPFHSRGCFQSMREDRHAGLIYGPFYLEGIGAVGHTDAAEILSFCAYCGADREWRAEHRALLAAGLSPLQTGERRVSHISFPKYPIGK